jgi:hypothetical protein
MGVVPQQSPGARADKSAERADPRTLRGASMTESLYDCNCDVVIEMQEMGVGVEEILQYARGLLSTEEIRGLIAGLEQMVPRCEPIEHYLG